MLSKVATAGDRRGVWAMIKEGYEGLVSTVIRPLRAQYTVEELGPKRSQIGSVAVQRVDVRLKNPAGYTLECSWWKPRKTKGEAEEKLPCIVVLHGNSSCRLGALEIVMYAIPAGFTVFALDFCGSGLSEGKYVSLGYHEQTDIATAVKYVRKTGETSSLSLWGRSMGSVAALLYAESDPSVNAMVLDSPFSSLPQLATELVEDGKLGVPRIAVKLVMRLIRRDIKKRAKFDMFKLKPIAKIHKYVPPFMLHNGPNQLFKFPGGHNSPRPFNFFIQALQFLRVMVGLLPLPADLSTFDLSPSQQVQSGGSRPQQQKRKKSSRVYKNPLEPGVSIEAVHKMSVRELKQAIDRAGYSDVTCIEKKEMVDLVLKLYARYRRSSKQAANDRQQTAVAGAGGEASAVPATLQSATNPSVAVWVAPDSSEPTSATATAKRATTPVGRRHSEGDVATDEETSAPVSPGPLLSMKSSTSSILSDAELARRLSIDHPSDVEEDSLDAQEGNFLPK
ncbi:hypothetical protein BBJ28_00011921 [Nothophytophthora sp. Chile5]|nr:hypothetical protein BBJ28_00011921 [Nothophytophthora sp. Chile5]